MGALPSAVAATALHRAALFVEAPSVVSGHWRSLTMDQNSSKEYPPEDLLHQECTTGSSGARPDGFYTRMAKPCVTHRYSPDKFR
jgi:hypothetical protein